MMGNHLLKFADFETWQKYKALLLVLTDDQHLAETQAEVVSLWVKNVLARRSTFSHPL